MHHSSPVSVHFIKYGSRNFCHQLVSRGLLSLWIPRQLSDAKDSCRHEQADADIWHGGRPAWRWGMVLQPSGILCNTTCGLQLLLTRQWAVRFHEFRKVLDSERLSALQWHVLGVSSTKSLMSVHSEGRVVCWNAPVRNYEHTSRYVTGHDRDLHEKRTRVLFARHLV